MGRHVKYRELDGAANSVLLPKGTTVQRPSSPQAGQLRYNTTLNMLEFYNGSNFVNLAGGDEGKSTITVDSITIDGLTPTYAYVLPSGIQPTSEESVLVFIGGVHQSPTSYTIVGSTITLSLVLGSDDGETMTVLHGFDTV